MNLPAPSAEPSEQAAAPYPRAAVLWTTLLCGAPLGGIWMAVAIALGAFAVGGMRSPEAFGILLLLPFFLIFGTFLGFVPAAVMSCILAVWQPYRSAANTVLAAAAGAAVSALFGVLMQHFDGGAAGNNGSIYMFALAGGLSEATLALSVFPRRAAGV
ncbi:TPA: hypothetical protein ACFNMI_001740 [Neisseria bacilliformis]|uniref:hypothetical protein n=1 Tax=Neisseria bacilliformis TaxID=267212 RepID=UPI0006667FDB|nr:hypothetical protein [Neisseria bacilliformis]